MSVEDRIRILVQKIIDSQDDGETALLTEELLDAIKLRVVHLRHKLERIPLGQLREPFN
jgi:signal transduction histidine kinase